MSIMIALFESWIFLAHYPVLTVFPGPSLIFFLGSRSVVRDWKKLSQSLFRGMQHFFLTLFFHWWVDITTKQAMTCTTSVHFNVTINTQMFRESLKEDFKAMTCIASAHFNVTITAQMCAGSLEEDFKAAFLLDTLLSLVSWHNNKTSNDMHCKCAFYCNNKRTNV